MTKRTRRTVSATADAQDRIPQKRSRKVAAKVEHAEATRIVWALRRQGLSFQAIEDRTAKDGRRVSRSNACDLYHAELKRFAAETKADVETYRAAAIARLEWAISCLEPIVAGGDARAVQALGKLQDQINKITAVYAPLKVEVDDNRWKRMTDDELQAELQAGAAKLGFRLAAQ